MSKEMNWKSVDLNLLVTFSHLYRHRSVSVAAAKAFVSQSAMSHSLSRLRVLLDDTLFERKGHHMEPTEHAHHIAPVVMRLLDTVSSELLSREPFAPQNYSGICRIGLTDYAEFIYAPILYDAIRNDAPNAQISFINVNRNNYLKVAEQEKLDALIGSIPNVDESFESQKLYTEEHVCLYDPSIVSIGGGLSAETFASIDQALVSPDGSLTTQVDKRLEELGLKRQVTVASRNFLTIRSLLKGRRLIAIVPKLMAKNGAFSDHLATAVPPINVPDFDISLLWSVNQRQDDKNTWLRSIVISALSAN
ncbi:LysR family transcriptional regulator [Vibrio sp. SCSIO 43135]|uniref:LysR family transcriptional regulator n=1 Tax=Vibrio sp. SCSIO 43135 TaxID=2819096 RepID=UPI0020754F19|nr:LysR family transcriptional regulator [Vibrio sp. SCSIO 43135]USD40625.1 LysR family transcriptional regulator [Vibrio sp. SCSIO 43135]